MTPPRPARAEWDAADLPISLFGLEFSLDTASLDALETVTRALPRARVGEAFAHRDDTEEVALLSTCHRVELLLLVSDRDEVERWRESLPGDREAWRVREGRDVVRHLFRVAAGRESLAVGEAEVRHQVRLAASAVESRHPRRVLRDLFLGAADAADDAFPSVPPSASIASVAAARLLDLTDRPNPRVVVVGSGTVGRQVVESLAPSARVTVVYHERPPEGAFLRAFGARTVPFDRLASEVAAADAVVTAAKFGHHALGASDLPRDHPVVLVDLGVPRNIDPDVRALPSVRLVDLEELHRLSESFPTASGADDGVDESAERFSDRWERRLLEPWVDAFRRSAEEVRRSEVANARPFLGPLDPSQEAAVDRLTRRLVARLLLPATERIRSLPSGPEGRRQRRFAVALLRPQPVDP